MPRIVEENVLALFSQILGLVSSQKILQFFSDFSSNRILWHMHGALNNIKQMIRFKLQKL